MDHLRALPELTQSVCWMPAYRRPFVPTAVTDPNEPCLFDGQQCSALVRFQARCLIETQLTEEYLRESCYILIGYCASYVKASLVIHFL